MDVVVLSHKGEKLMKLFDAYGFKSVDDLAPLSVADSLCPAICMTEGCEFMTEMESDQDEGYCEVCGGNTVTSVLVLTGLI
jgi:hypothetical protein